MPDLFPLLDCSQQPIQCYDPNRHSYGLGEKCSSCNKAIVYQQTITICKCHRYCHKKCILQSLNAENKNHQQFQYRCIVCQSMLSVYYDVTIRMSCRFKLKNLIGFIISALVTFLVICWMYQIRKPTLLDLTWICAILSFCFVFTFIFLANMVLTRDNQISSMGSTNLQLLISAFIGLEQQITEENTQTEMIRKDKNEHL